MIFTVCDDNTNERQQLSAMLLKCGKAVFDTDIKILQFISGEQFLNNIGAIKDKVQIVFMDIFMGNGANGMEVIHKLREIDSEMPIVFITTSMDFAVEGFEVNAIDYVVKPISEGRITKTLERCAKQISAKLKSISIVYDRINTNIFLKDITHIEIYNNDCIIHTVSDEFRIRYTLAAMMEDLNDRRFLRCHRSYIVNMDFVEKMNDSTISLTTKTEVPITTRERTSIKQMLANYIWGTKL